MRGRGPVRVLVWEGEVPGPVDQAAGALRWQPPGWEAGR